MNDEITQEPVSYPIDLSHATPELFAALHKAQQQAETVGKDARNTHGDYNYATAEAMIRAGRACRKDTGLALLTTTTLAHAPPPKGDPGQWVCATISTHWVLTHEGGGFIIGRSELDAMASRRRPNDKAVKAADTFLRGFIERDVFDLDRAEEDKDSVDQRGDEDYKPAQVAPSPDPKASYAALYEECKNLVLDLEANIGKIDGPAMKAHRQAAGIPETGKLNMGQLKKYRAYLKDQVAAVSYPDDGDHPWGDDGQQPTDGEAAQ